jgi:hypothetical protein
MTFCVWQGDEILVGESHLEWASNDFCWFSDSSLLAKSASGQGPLVGEVKGSVRADEEIRVTHRGDGRQNGADMAR